MFLSKILIHSSVTIYYIVEENNFVVIVYTLLVRQKYYKSNVNDSFKINRKQMVKIPKQGENVRYENYERKIKSPFMI